MCKDMFCVQPWAALIIGLISGVVYVFSSKLVSNVLKVDDPLDAAAVHGFCGAWGLIAAALFAAERHLASAYGVDHSHFGKSLLDVGMPSCFFLSHASLVVTSFEQLSGVEAQAGLFKALPSQRTIHPSKCCDFP